MVDLIRSARAELWIVAPDQLQKLQYTTLKLFDQLESENTGTNEIEVMSAYLMDRQSDLKEIRFTEKAAVFDLQIVV